MLLTLRFSGIGEADTYTHLLFQCGRLERVCKGELEHDHVGIVGNLNFKQLNTIHRLVAAQQRLSRRLKVYGPDWG